MASYRVPYAKKGLTDTEAPVITPSVNHVSIAKVGSLTCMIITKESVPVLDVDTQVSKLNDTEVKAEFQVLTGRVKSKAEIDAEFKAS